MRYPQALSMRRLTLVLLIGPVLVSILSGVDFLLYNSNEPFPAFFAVCGAVWGLTTGILQRSLKSALFGLNTGALLGYAFFIICDGFNFSNFSALVLVTFFGALLGLVLNLHRGVSWSAAAAGFASGAAAFCALGTIGCAQYPLFDRLPISIHAWDSRWIVIPVISTLPLMLGLSLFLWLLTDLLPNRANARTIKTSAAARR